MPKPALHILETVRAEMDHFTRNRTLVSLARAVGLPQSVCWRILHEDRAASFPNVERLLCFFGYKLVKDPKADHSRRIAKALPKIVRAGPPTKPVAKSNAKPRATPQRRKKV